MLAVATVMPASALAVGDGDEEGDEVDPVPAVVDLLQAASARTAAAPRAAAGSRWRPLPDMSCDACMSFSSPNHFNRSWCCTAAEGGGIATGYRLWMRDESVTRPALLGLLAPGACRQSTPSAGLASPAASTNATPPLSASPAGTPEAPGHSAAPGPASGLQGAVTAGPSCPVERVDSPCPPR